jgi:phosphoribosylformimino-5-aminoimidazole carboxamide ribotide isomerase
VSFEILGVVDLRRGLAVRARGGRRDEYAPIKAVAGESIPAGDAVALARQYADRFGLSSLYVADLDAIEQCGRQHAVVRTIASIGVPVWLDAGVAWSEDACQILECGAARLIVGLETLSSFPALESIVQSVGHERVVFSLDLRDGRPIAPASESRNAKPEDILARAADAGVTAAIVLDLARVGAGCGLDLPFLSRLRAATRSISLYAGGGVRSMDDLRQAQSAGCDGALVASALLDGTITTQDLRT